MNEMEDVKVLNRHFLYYFKSTNSVLIIPGKNESDLIYLYSLKTKNVINYQSNYQLNYFMHHVLLHQMNNL